VKQILEKYEVNNTDCVLSLLPLSHAYQLTAGMMVPLSQGVSNVFLSEVHSENLRRTIHKYEVTTLIAVPKVLKVMYGSIIRKFRSKYLRNFISRGVQMMIVTPLIVRRWLFRRAHLYLGPSLEKILVGGAFLPRYLDEFFQGAGYQVFIGYGLTETSPVVTISSSGKRKDGSVGYPVRGVQISQSEKGELLVSGDNVFLGYYPELRVDREFNTRDIVRITESGEIFIKGRTKNMITWPSGDKFFAEDLEYYIRRYCDVEEVCVVSEDVPDQSPRIFVAIIPEKNTIVSVGEVQAVLPRFVRIQEVKNFSKEDFPYTHTFKPDRKTILESFTTLKDRE
ncbi:MAG: AMP-binding protein, partial [Candidatus Paceibacteria bacterium]